MDDTEKARLVALRLTAMQTMALAVLLARNWGSVTFSRAEYHDIVEEFGGPVNLAIHMEAVGPKDGDGEVSDVRAFLVRKPPKNGELFS